MTISGVGIIILKSNAVVTFFSEWCSSQVPVGAHNQENRSTDDVEWFLSSIQFENREKLQELGLEF